jgi:hypothetical protein
MIPAAAVARTPLLLLLALAQPLQAMLLAVQLLLQVAQSTAALASQLSTTALGVCL